MNEIINNFDYSPAAGGQLASQTYDLAAAGPNLTTTGAIVLSLLGTAFTVFMATKVFHAYAKKDWGALVVEVLAGVVCAYFVLMPDSAVGMLKTFATSIFGA
ncbi:MAG TPA: hypothetical protein VIJ23_17620 [Mycobacterium sp.]